MGQRVAGEDLPAQHDEVPDQSGEQRNRGAGDQRVLDERMGEHVRDAGDRIARDRPHSGGRHGAPAGASSVSPADASRRPPRPARSAAARYALASRNSPNASVVTQNPIGYGEKNAMPSPTQVTTSAISTERARPSPGRAVSRTAVAAGATSSAKTSRLPVT